MAAQMSFDGIPVERVKGRASGTFDLDIEEANQSSIDGTFVAVVVCRLEDINAKLKRGELERINVYKIQELKLPDRALRDELIEKLGLYGADTLFSVTVPPPVNQQPTPPAGVDPETGAFEDDEFEEIDLPDVPAPAQESDIEEGDEFDGPVVIAPEPRPGAVAQPRGDGPKVAKFSDDTFDGPADREVIGPVRDGQRKDSALDRFLQEA